MNTPDNIQDVIDSRDVIARIDELTEELADLKEALEDAETDLADAETAEEKTSAQSAIDAAQAELKNWGDEAQELAALESLADEADGSPDWEHGETLIRGSYFRDYAQELAENCGEPIGDTWPQRCIDWDQAAYELKMDYFPVDFDGVEYFIRN